MTVEVRTVLFGLESKERYGKKDRHIADRLFDMAAKGSFTIKEWLMLQRVAARDGGMSMVARKFGHPPEDGYSDAEFSYPAA